MISIVMPALEMAQDTGKLIAWRKREGDRVSKGEPLLEIETDKAVVEIEAPGDGVLTGIKAREGAVVPVGQTIAWLLQPGEVVPTETRVQISPKARRLARERGIDLATVKGSGPGGEIVADDVLVADKIDKVLGGRPFQGRQGAAESPALQETASTAARLMAERTTASWTTVPHFFLSRDVDASALVAARSETAGITHTDRLVSCVARALKKHPPMNGGQPRVNVAIAIATDDAVVTGAIHDADTLSVAEISARRRDLTERARAGRLQPADISGATFTISNLGMYHVDAFTAIIVPPQAGILAVGAIADRVVAVDGQPAVRPMLTLTLSCDHRVVDGARGAAFLNDVVAAVVELPAC
jgi:pyruvate dehydrogenase E2 component (dihydrolipoamide acetyltransferase)